jgi:hypothetical protein
MFKSIDTGKTQCYCQSDNIKKSFTGTSLYRAYIQIRIRKILVKNYLGRLGEKIIKNLYYSLVVILCTHDTNIKIFNILPAHCAYVFRMNLSTNTDFFPYNIQWFASITKLKFDAIKFEMNP